MKLYETSFFRRSLLGLLLGSGLIMSASAQQQPGQPPSTAELFKPPIVLDAHVDILLRLLNHKGDRSLAEPGPKGQANFANWRAGGTNAVFFAVWIDPRQFQGQRAVDRAEQLIGEFQQQLRLYPDKLAQCDTSDDVRRVIASGKVAGLLGVEGGIAINNDLRNIERYRRQGVRYMTLTWRGNLDWAGSSQDLKNSFRKGGDIKIAENPSKGGLTDFGRQVVAEMNRVGMVVDLSHVSDQTFYDAIKASKKPVFVSHSDARALSDHNRNVTDDMLRTLHANGGVIGVNLWYQLLEPSGKGSKEEGAKQVNVDTVLDMIDHMIKVAGIDTVGIGTDYEGMDDLPEGLETAAGMIKIFEGMRKRGYSEADIRKFAGENFLRVLKANEVGSAPVSH